MAMSPERKAQLIAEIEAEIGRPLLRRGEPAEVRPPPQIRVVTDRGRVVAPAEVAVSPADPNWGAARGGVVRLNLAAAERQREAAEAEAAQWRRRQRDLDPFGYGHWGPRED